jgi:hypothetical protein
MRITSEQLAKVQAGYVLAADVIGAEHPELYVVGNRPGYVATLIDLTGRPDVLQVHSYRLAPAADYAKPTPTPLIVEDFGTMAGYLWSGDEFALDGLDGRGDDE